MAQGRGLGGSSSRGPARRHLPAIRMADSAPAQGYARECPRRIGRRACQLSDFTYVRRLSMNNSTGGLKVRSLSVTIATGKFGPTSLIGSCLRPLHSGLRRSIDLGIADTK